jgi:arylsulfatase
VATPIRVASLASEPGAWVPTPRSLLDTEPEPPSPFTPALTVLPGRRDDGVLRLGLSAAEPGEGRPFVWSSQPRSTIAFSVERPAPARLQLRCAPFRYEGAPPQSIELHMNGRSLATLELGPALETHVVDVAQDLLRSGSNVLELRYAWSAAPADVIPGSRDPRLLGVRFELLRIELLRPRPAVVQVVLPDGSGERALLADRPGSTSYLALLPDSPRLRLGGALLSESGLTTRVRVEIESDAGSEILLEADPVANAPERWDLDLAPFAGRAVRLRLRVVALDPEARFAWIEPRLLSKVRPPEGEPPTERLNLVVIVLDAASPRRFGVYGHDAGTTPHLDALAREAVVFENARSPAAYTLASTASLFTSRLPAHHGVVEKSDRLAPDMVTLAEVLREAGYDAAAFSSNGFVSREFGMEQGFDTFEELYLDHPGDPVRGEEILAAVDRWLESREGGRPFLLYLHFLQPHEPYGVAAPHFYRDLDESYEGEVDGSYQSMRRIFRGEYQPDAREIERLGRLYDGNLRYGDHVVGTLQERLDELDLLDRSVVVATSDHGEALGERGLFGHNWMVDPEVIDIPLLMRFPSALGLRGRVRDLVDTLDLAPTLLSAVGVPIPPEFEGRDLLPLVRGEDPGAPSLRLSRSAHHHPIVGIEMPGLRYVSDPNQGRVLLQADGREITLDEFASQKPVTTAFLAMAAARLGTPTPGVAAKRAAPLDETTAEALRALGYVLD